jgi:energy-coupling factor transport system substrate-specific component
MEVGNTTRKLQVKDFINVGIFTAIYYVIMFALGSVTALVPVLFLFFPAIMAFVGGTIYMMFLTKVQKRGMIFIMAVIVGFGHFWITSVISAVWGIIAEFLTAKGKFKSFKWNMAGYCAFSCWAVGSVLPVWLMRDTYLQAVIASTGTEYGNLLAAITPWWVLPAEYILTILFAVLGAYFGRKILKKHFIKAGIV